MNRKQSSGTDMNFACDFLLYLYMTDRTIDTNLEEEDFDKFNAEWESGWNPVLKTDPSLVLTESSSSDGFLTSLKNSLKFW